MRKVLAFNLIRNKMVWDSSIENDLLKKEIQEFYEATDLAERIEAMINVRYVYEGTQLKANYNMLPMDERTNKIVGQFHRLSTTMVADELGDDSQYLDKIMDKAWDIVCDINAKKVSELDANGKVIKQKDLPNATELIANMLDGALTK